MGADQKGVGKCSEVAMVTKRNNDDTLNKDTRNVDRKQSMMLRVTEQIRQDLFSIGMLGDTGGGALKEQSITDNFLESWVHSIN